MGDYVYGCVSMTMHMGFFSILLINILAIGPGSVDLWQQNFLKSPENKIKINLTAGAAHDNGIYSFATFIRLTGES